MTSFCKLNSCTKLMLNWKHEVGRRKLYQWTTILLDSHNCNLFRTATRRTLYIANFFLAKKKFHILQLLCYTSLCFLDSDIPLDVQVALQLCMFADYLFCQNGSWSRGEKWHIRCYYNFKDNSKQSTRNITLKIIIVFIFNKVSDLFWKIYLI